MTASVVASAPAGSNSLERVLVDRLYHQAALLDEQRWQDYIELFAATGRYWMPSYPEQSSWDDAPSIFIEDRDSMHIRRKRLEHPRAWSRQAPWGTSHVVANVRVLGESAHGVVRTTARFLVTERRRDDFRQFAGSYTHDWVVEADDYRIMLQRVDLLGADVPFEYVLQAWL